LAVRHARLSWWEISLGDRWVITRPRMLPGPRNASRGRRRAKSQRTHARCARQARWAGTDNNCINITHRVPVRFAMPLPMAQIRLARHMRQQPIRRGPFLDRRVTSDAGNREACGDDPRGSFVIFSDVGLFRGRRPVLCGALSETVRLTGSSRGRFIFVSSFAFTVIMLGRRPRRHCCTRFVVRCARPARGEGFA
jgi:hypothetical protein